jgi:H+-translocating NAD(P) transhydrogenase subunit alpha
MNIFQNLIQHRSVTRFAIVAASVSLFLTFGSQAKLSYGFQDSQAKTPAEVTAVDAKSVESSPPHPVSVENENGQELPHPKSNRFGTLVISLTIFALSVFVGFEVIAKVPPTLHTPLMSGSNAISGITIVGALIAAGNKSGGLAAILGMIAIVFAMINVVGGYMVTHRMLKMFKKR